jgi:NADH-quinone oxidoreductase subunit K
MIPISYYLVLAALIFFIGALGFVIRRNAIVVFMCLEMMLNAVNLTFVSFSQSLMDLHGQLAVFFVMVVAAAEAAIGLAIIIAVFRSVRSVETSDVGEMKH